ncbi:MAG TPA: PilZ domain-containing protein [Terriglobales bacterium]|nr:PilZ domain-containing protein [Terriglobales bacterium]
MGKSSPTSSPYSKTRRRFPRFQLDVRLTAQVFRAGGVVSLWGRTSELGQDGIGGTLTGELDLGEVASLEFALPVAIHPLKLRAVVRYRDGLRHGFEFLTLSPIQRDDIVRTCEMLSVGD